MSSQAEPEWDDVERDWMLALEDYRRNVLCPCGCGYPAEVSQDPMTEFRAYAGPVRCHVRTALVRAQKDQQGVPHPEGRLWVAKLRD